MSDGAQEPRAAGSAGRLSLDRIERAMTVIDPVFLRTPQFVADALSARLGTRVLCKVETVNPIRSFKGRGADCFCAALPRGGHVVCASAGNFGQGMAYAARKRDVAVTIFAATNASPLKVERMRRLGATVHLHGADLDDAKAHARAWAAARGLPFVEDGREPAISEGAGTIGVELAAWPEPIARLFVPVGNGALVAGVATWMRAHAPDTRIVAVSAAGAPAMARSWRARRVERTDAARTIADGIAIRVPIPEAVADIQDLVDDWVLVSDDEIRRAMRWLYEDLGLLVEPAGAVGIAAIAAERDLARGRDGDALVATPLCGGNLTDAQVRAWIWGEDATSRGPAPSDAG
jgi:threonine dehydratase